MSIYFILCIVAAFMWAVANILAKYLLKWLNTKDVFSINFLLMAVLLMFLSPVFYSFTYSWVVVALVISIGIIDSFANFFYFESLKNNDTSIITPVLSISPVFTFILSWFFIFEHISLASYFLCLLIVLLIVIFSTNSGSIEKMSFKKVQGAIVSSLLFGISAIPAKYLLTTLWAINAPTLYMFRAGIIGLFSLLIFNFGIPKLSLKEYRFIGLRWIVVIIQWTLFYYCISKIPVGVWATIFSTTPIFVFLLSAVFLGEKFTVKKLITSFLVILASVLIYFNL